MYLESSVCTEFQDEPPSFHCYVCGIKYLYKKIITIITQLIYCVNIKIRSWRSKSTSMICWLIDENDYYFILGSMLTEKNFIELHVTWKVIQERYCSLQRKNNINKNAIKTHQNHGILFIFYFLNGHSQLWDSTDLALLYFPEALEIFHSKINYIVLKPCKKYNVQCPWLLWSWPSFIHMKQTKGK